MRVLLTGATGFVGAAIAAHLADKGWTVVGLHGGRRGGRPGRGAVLDEVIADVGDPAATADLADRVQACDFVVHAAACLDMRLTATDVARVNCLGMQNMLALAQRWGSRKFVFLSSVPVIGRPLHLPVTEQHPVAPRTAYHASKLFGEQLVQLAAQSGAMAGTSLRLTAPVGPGLPKGRLLAMLAIRALRHQPLALSGTGLRRQNYVDVRDVACAVEGCLTRDVSGIFNVAGASAISNLELAGRCISQSRSRATIEFNGAPDPEEGFDWDVSIARARTELGYEPRYGVDEAIAAAMAEADMGGV